VQNNARIDNSQ